MAMAVFFRGARPAPPRGRRGSPGRLPPAQTGSQRKQPPPARRGTAAASPRLFLQKRPLIPPETPAFPSQNTRFSLRNTRFSLRNTRSPRPPKQPGEATPRPRRHYSGGRAAPAVRREKAAGFRSEIKILLCNAHFS